ncbi:MAG: rod-binding protein [Sphingomonas sp.]
MTPGGPTTGLPAGTLDAANVSKDTSRLSTRANLEAAGTKFEAVFTHMMLKSMRSVHLADDIFSSQATDTFREMQDQKTAQIMAEHHPLGIGKAMVDFLSKTQPELGGASVPGGAEPEAAP